MDITNRKTLAIIALVSLYGCSTSCCCVPSLFKHDSKHSSRLNAKLSAAAIEDPTKIEEELYLLHAAAYNGQASIVEVLLEAIPDERERLEYIKQRRSDGLSALQLAAFNRHEDVVQLMLRSVPHMDIFDAAETGHIARVKELIRSVPQENILEYLMQKNSEEQTPLHLAAEKGHLEVIRILTDAVLVYEARILVNAANDYGCRAIHLAAIYGDGKKLPKDIVDRYGEIIRLLVNNGADIDCRDCHEQTPLHNAALRGNCKMSQVLVALGANVDLRDKREDGQSAAELAWTYKRLHTKTTLKDTLKFLIGLSRISTEQLHLLWYSRLIEIGFTDREVEELFATYRPVETHESQKQVPPTPTPKEPVAFFETHESQKQVPQTTPFHLGFTQKELVGLFETYESENQAPQAAQ